MVYAPIKRNLDILEMGKGISNPWRNYFDEIDNKINTGKIDSYTLTEETILTAAHLGRVIKVNNSNLSWTVTLPSVTESNVDSWIIIIRLGDGSLRIKAADSDTIESSSAGGFIRCDEGSERVLANVKLYLATATQWAILAGTGIWKVF
jgi:hypothetical protein